MGPDRHNSTNRSRRGLWTIVAMFALGGAVLLGLFLSPRAKSPSAPPDVPWGVPNVPVNVLLYDVEAASQGGRGLREISADLRGRMAAPDYVLLLRVRSDQVLPLAAAVGMTETYHPRHYQKVVPGGAEGASGVCILSKHPLYEATPFADGADKPLGLSAVSVIGGRKFFVACATPRHDSGSRTGEPPSVLASWKKAASPPPAIIGGGAGMGLEGSGFRDPMSDVARSGTAWYSRGGAVLNVMVFGEWFGMSGEARPDDRAAESIAVTVAPGMQPLHRSANVGPQGPDRRNAEAPATTAAATRPAAE